MKFRRLLRRRWNSLVVFLALVFVQCIPEVFCGRFTGDSARVKALSMLMLAKGVAGSLYGKKRLINKN